MDGGGVRRPREVSLKRVGFADRWVKIRYVSEGGVETETKRMAKGEVCVRCVVRRRRQMKKRKRWRSEKGEMRIGEKQSQAYKAACVSA